MGLGNEERFEKALYTLLGMLGQLDTREYTTWKDDWAKEHVDAVRESATQLLGMIVQRLDTTSAYWLMGESSSGLRSLTCEFFRAEDSQDYFNMLMDDDSDRGGHGMSLANFSGRLGFNRHPGMKELADWWELWAYIPAILYPVNRYEDRLFNKEFKQELNRLIASMMQLKQRLVAYKDLDQKEKVLLLKYSFFDDSRYNDDVPLDDRLETLRNMTQEELEEAVKQRYRDREARIRKSDDKPKKVDPVQGKGVISANEKIHTLCEEFECSHSIAVQALWRSFDHDLDEARELVPYFLREDAKKNPKTCMAGGCKKVLDYRNKSGYCKKHYKNFVQQRKK